ncbi:MAG TPA: metallophosphoesterase [Rubricoccaceae bacterium]|jgi:3',5'-cyclic AMP phosphodiesterase CpdA
MDPDSRPLFTVAHLSDIHFGKIAHPGIVAALVDEVNAADVGVVAVSGDLTQRARRREFADARAMLDSFRPPVVVVPGNHDVRAWWHNPLDRVWRSTTRFRQTITPVRVPAVESGGVLVVGINSAHGLTVKGGRIRPEALAAMERRFAAAAPDTFRILVVHHHLVRLAALGDHDVARGARRALAVAHRARVDLVLCGHLHRSHVESIEVAPRSASDPGHRIVIASAGTATSSRGRAENAGTNFYNWVTVGEESFSVAERQFDPEAGVFTEARATTFVRNRPGPAPVEAA